jgi:hypothetical protein
VHRCSSWHPGQLCILGELGIPSREGEDKPNNACLVDNERCPGRRVETPKGFLYAIGLPYVTTLIAKNDILEGAVLERRTSHV